jgi:hypothetical protein
MRILAFLLLASVASAGTNIPLGDLNATSDRFPQWYPADVAEQNYFDAKDWPEYDASCENAPCPSGRQGYKDAPGNPMGGCAAVDPADNGGQDWSQLNCIIGAAPSQSVIFLPNGVYDAGNVNGNVFKISRGNVVLRGESNSLTIMQGASYNTNGDVNVGWVNGCGWSKYTDNETCGATVLSVSSSNHRPDPDINWTAGFEQEDTVVTLADASSFNVNDWIELGVRSAHEHCQSILQYPPYLDNQGQPNPNKNSEISLTHIAQVASKNGNQITLDRGLRMTYPDGSCRSNGYALKMSTIENIGIENVNMTTDSSITQSDIDNGAFLAIGPGVMHSWMVGNHLNRSESNVVNCRFNSRNWFQGNKLSNYGRIGEPFNTSAISPNGGCVDNVWENNAFSDAQVGFYLVQGPEGNVIAYNYYRAGSPPWGSGERFAMNHGFYSRETLIEGNDTNLHTVVTDRWWGENGPRHTAYRNRHVKKPGAVTEWEWQIGTNQDRSGDWDSGSYVNIIGNIAKYFYTTGPPGGGNDPSRFPSDVLQNGWDIDGGRDNDGKLPFMHLEKNVFIDEVYGWTMISPNSQTNCGTGQGLCPAGTPTANGGVFGTNVAGSSAPAGWSNDTIPHSLYRDANPPSWWCQEACDWADVHNGIGAWGDDFDGTLCKLPAELLYSGGTCTPMTAAPPSSLGGVVLKGVVRH